MAETAVVGLGNPYVADEGIGIRLVAELSERYDCQAIDVFDLGADAFRIIHLLENRKKIVIIDCAFMGSPSGSIKKFSPHDVISVKKLTHFSLHEGDLFGVIALAGDEKKTPPEIVIFGIEPERLSMGEGLSSALEEKIPEYLEDIAAECGVVKRSVHNA